MTPFEVYLALRLDDIRTLFQGFGIFSMIIGVLIFVPTIIIIDEKGFSKKWIMFPLSLILLAMFSFTAFTFLPTTKDVALIYGIPTIVNDKDIRETVDDGKKIMRELTREYLKSLLEKQKDKKETHGGKQ